MLKQSVSGKKFKAITYSTPKNIAINEFSCELRKGITCPQLLPSRKILIPSEKNILSNFVMIEVEGCGICGTDIHMYRGKRFLDEKPSSSNLIIPGHEIFGKVVSAQGKFDYLLNKEIVINPIIDCYEKKKCYYCRINKNYMHTPFREMGICGRVPGGFAEYAVGLAKNCFLVKNLSYKHRALIEPLATIIYALKYVMNLSQSPKRYLVIGSGPAGLLMLQYLKKLSAKNSVVLMDKNQHKLAISKKLGADKILCADGLRRNEIISDLLKMSGKEGFECILEATGNDEVIGLIPFVSSKLANVLLYGLGHKKVSIENFDMIIEKEIKIYSSLGASNNESFKEALNLISEFNVAKIITHEYRSLESVEKAVEKDCFNKEYIKGVLLI